MKEIFKPVTLAVAQILVTAQYSKDTPFIWDRHNPRFREGGKPTDPEIAWKLSRAKPGHYDFVCDLRAPSRLTAALFFIKLAVRVLRGRV